MSNDNHKAAFNIIEKAEADTKKIFASEDERAQEVIASIEARSGGQLAVTAKVSIDLMHVMLQLYTALVAHRGNPMGMDEILNQIKTTHSDAVAHMLSMACHDQDKRKRELDVILKLMESRFKVIMEANEIAAEAAKKLHDLM